MDQPNKLNQVTFIITQLFSLVYLGLGLAVIFLKDFMPWLDGWIKLAFGVACIFYAGIRFYRSYLLWREQNP